MDYSHLNPLVPPDTVVRWINELPRPVALTGGTGFVGSHLVDTLVAGGIAPRVLVRDPVSPRWIGGAPVEWIPGSLADDGSLKRLVRDAGTVFHLAGVLRAGRERDFDLGNRGGTENVVAAVREYAPGARLVHVSSLAAMGPSADRAGLGPEATPAPISWYGRSKLAAENVVRGCGDSLWWSIVRPPAVYGPRDSDVFEFFRMASRGVVAIPSGERWLTVVWAGDVVAALLAAAAGRPNTTYHLGEPDPILLERLISDLCDAGGVKCRMVRIPPFVVKGVGSMGSALQKVGWRRLPMTGDKARELLARHWTAETRSSMETLDIQTVTGFHEGAARCWAWYRQHGWLR